MHFFFFPETLRLHQWGAHLDSTGQISKRASRKIPFIARCERAEALEHRQPSTVSNPLAGAGEDLEEGGEPWCFSRKGKVRKTSAFQVAAPLNLRGARQSRLPAAFANAAAALSLVLAGGLKNVILPIAATQHRRDRLFRPAQRPAHGTMTREQSRHAAPNKTCAARNASFQNRT